jgi:hypothetical protein
MPVAWTFEGHPKYIDRAADRLRIPRVITDRLKNPPKVGLPGVAKRPFPDITQIGRTVAGMSQELVELGRRGQPVSAPRTAQIRRDLAMLEEALAILHVLAAASQQVIDEVHLAYGYKPPTRPFRVECDFDPPIETNAETPGDQRRARRVPRA